MNFSDLIIYYNDWSLSHISCTLVYSAIIAGVGYEVHWDITTGQLPYKEWSKEQPWTREKES